MYGDLITPWEEQTVEPDWLLILMKRMDADD